jgi:hypothetical protein
MPGYLLASSPLRESHPESRAGIRALGEQNEAEGSTRAMRGYQDQRPLCREAAQSSRTAFGHKRQFRLAPKAVIEMASIIHPKRTSVPWVATLQLGRLRHVV